MESKYKYDIDLVVMDANMNELIVIDNCESFVWTDRYNSIDDFVLDLPMTKQYVDLVQPELYLKIVEHDRIMFIEEVLVETHMEDGYTIQVKGSSPSTILKRRIVYDQINIDGDFQTGVEKILNDNVINPTDPLRKIPGFVFKKSTDPRITSLTLTMQVTYATVYEAIDKMCKLKNVGFQVNMDKTGSFSLELFMGEDRSYLQTKNPYVVFSPHNDNLLSSNHLKSDKLVATFLLIGGEGEGTARVLTTTHRDPTKTGINRRELFVDARDLSSNAGSDDEIPMVEYIKQLKERGDSVAEEYVYVNYFDGVIDATGMYKYGIDFYIGDVVQIENEVGLEARVRVEEILFTTDVSGISAVPTFVMIEE